MIAHIEHKFAWTYVEGEDGKQFPLSILAHFPDYFTLTNVPDIRLETQFSVNNRDQWAELGLAIQHLYHDQHVNGQNYDRGLMMISGLPVDNQSRHWKLICSQAQEFPRAYINPSQDIIKKVIDKHILYTDIPPHEAGQMWVVEYFQRIKVQLQNQIFESRDNICAMLRQAMIMPVTR